MRLDEDGYAAMTRLLREAAAEACDGRLAFVLEGGYNIEAQARSVSSVIRTMLGGEPEIPSEPPRGPWKDVVDRTRAALHEHWKAIF
jgi:acetoin utilization deacetylase AcuC-like enzyme